MQFHPSQQKCSLLQDIPKHASIILQVHNILRQIICVNKVVWSAFHVAYVSSSMEASKRKDNNTVVVLVSLCLWLKHKVLKNDKVVLYLVQVRTERVEWDFVQVTTTRFCFLVSRLAVPFLPHGRNHAGVILPFVEHDWLNWSNDNTPHKKTTG